MTADIIQGDARRLKLPDNSVDLIITSPPYWAMRTYVDGGEYVVDQIGDEPTPAEYIANLTKSTIEWTRVLKPTGSLWVNMGDKYGRGSRTTISGTRSKQRAGHDNTCVPSGSPKSLLQLPQRYAIACVDQLGLTLRAEVIWRKTNPIPDPTRDRVGRGHETIYHLAKSPKYYAAAGVPQTMAVWDMRAASLRVPGHVGARHHSTFPLELPRRVIERWCPPGGIVLDPFGGTGTTALMADVMGRHGISVDLSADYCRIARWRLSDPDQRTRALLATRAAP